MKDLSIFLLKKSLASKMKRGVRSACNGVVSTTTMNQSKGADADAANVSCVAAPSLSGENNLAGSPKTLEEMLLQLDIEEAAARRARLDEYGELNRRMSCVNNSDVLSSARDALSHYPRFSLDGKDAMYRSFRNSYVNLEGGRNSVGGGFCRGGGYGCGYELDVEKSLRLPPTVAGECVVWCRPGVVAQLMGLEAVPVPVPGRGSRSGKRLSFSDYRKRRMGRYELEKDRIAMSIGGGCKEGTGREREGAVAGYCATKPASTVVVRGGGGGVRGGRGL